MARRNRAPRLAVALLLLGAALTEAGVSAPLPWRQAGLDERQAAAHLLDRLTFGPRPGDVDRVVELGPEDWLDRQLAADLDDAAVERRLAGLEALTLDVRRFPEVYPNVGRVLQEAMQAGILPAEFDRSELADGGDRRRLRRELLAFARRRGYRLQRELVGELLTQKLYRATYSERQLVEVLTDFWFNHFNVSLTDNECRVFVLSFERDAIRPHVLGSFRQLLGATAKHPAMLLYLDNARSTAGEGELTTLDGYMRELEGRRAMARRRAAVRARRERAGRPRGLNENYARELLELHTLGVDGGYTQQDVTETARALTGWTIYPPSAVRERHGRRLERALASGAGFVADGGFLFRADAHDAGAKEVLGTRLPAGRGLEDGEQVLDLVSRHPATARHLARKLAVRFVADDPPAALVDRLAAVFQATDGDLERLLRALVESPEFWSPAVRRQKIKSPFELAVSALRALAAEVVRPRATVEWVERMGQPLFAYQAPTGYPDRAESWVNTGALLNRMNFGLALAAGRVEGVEHDLLALAGGREPESRGEALRVYLPLLLPERDAEATYRLLEPLALEPALAAKVDDAAPAPAGRRSLDAEEERLFGRRSGARRRSAERPAWGEPTPLEQVVGVILGSPEFQRR